MLKSIASLRTLNENIKVPLLEQKLRCDPECKKKYVDKGGSFNKNHGSRFNSCVQMFLNCCSGLQIHKKDKHFPVLIAIEKAARRLCGFIGRKKM